MFPNLICVNCFLSLFIYFFALIQSTDFTDDITVQPPITTSAYENQDGEKAKLLWGNLTKTLEVWSKFHFGNGLLPSSWEFNIIIRETFTSTYNVFKLGKELQKWFYSEKSKENTSATFEKIKCVTDKVIHEIEKMDEIIHIGLLQVPDHKYPVVGTFLGLMEGKIKNITNLIKIYIQNFYQDNLTNDDFYHINTNVFKAFDLLEYKMSETLNFTINLDPLNDQLFIDVVNMYVAAIKQLIMVNAASDFERPQLQTDGVFEKYKGRIDRMLSILRFKYIERKIEFNETVKAIIKNNLDEGIGNSKTAENIYTNLTETFDKYNFAVAVYDINNNVDVPQNKMEGNVFPVFYYKGKNAFVIPNLKPQTINQKYVECPFWIFLSETEVCEKANGKNISNIIPMIKLKCPEISNLAIIRTVPHSIIGYVSSKFDRIAFPASGIGLGDCFHYSIFIANKFK